MANTAEIDAAAETTEHAAETTEYAAETTEYAAETTEYAAETTEYAAETTEYAAETTEETAETTEETAETTEHAAETTYRVAETSETDATETTDYAAETSKTAYNTEVTAETLPTVDMTSLDYSDLPSNDEEDAITRQRELQLQSLSEQELRVHLENVVSELRLIQAGSLRSWQHEVIMQGFSSLCPTITRKDLSINMNYSSFTDKQVGTVLSFIKDAFPSIKEDYIFYVLIPEALTRVVKASLGLSHEDALELLEKSLLLREEVAQEFQVKFRLAQQ